MKRVSKDYPVLETMTNTNGLGLLSPVYAGILVEKYLTH